MSGLKWVRDRAGEAAVTTVFLPYTAAFSGFQWEGNVPIGLGPWDIVVGDDVYLDIRAALLHNGSYQTFLLDDFADLHTFFEMDVVANLIVPHFPMERLYAYWGDEVGKMFMESVASLALSFISLSFSLFLYVSLTLSPAREAMANAKEGEEPDFVPFIRWKRFGKPLAMVNYVVLTISVIWLFSAISVVVNIRWGNMYLGYYYAAMIGTYLIMPSGFGAILVAIALLGCSCCTCRPCRRSSSDDEDDTYRSTTAGVRTPTGASGGGFDAPPQGDGFGGAPPPPPPDNSGYGAPPPPPFDFGGGGFDAMPPPPPPVTSGWGSSRGVSGFI